MDIQQLRYFCAIVETGSITKAAQDMFISQPALTKSLQKLEIELGLPLFDRVKKNLVLNDAGQSAYQHFSAVLSQLDQLDRDFRKRRKIPDKILICNRLSIFSEYLLPDYDQKFPGQIELVPASDDESLANMLCNGHVTLVLSDAPICGPGIVCKSLFTDEILLRIPENSEFSKQESIQLSSMCDMPFVHGTNYPTIQQLQQLILDHGLPITLQSESKENPPTSNSYLIYRLITDNAVCFTTVLSSSYLYVPNYKSKRLSDSDARFTYYASYLQQNRTLVFPFLDWAKKRNEQAIKNFEG